MCRSFRVLRGFFSDGTIFGIGRQALKPEPARQEDDNERIDWGVYLPGPQSLVIKSIPPLAQVLMNIEGTLAQFNYSPKGGYEALIVTTKKGPVQVNFEPDQAGVLAATLKPGGKVSFKTGPAHEKDDAVHPVCQLISVKVKGKAVKLEPKIEVKGVVQRLNYALHGEVNGVVLDNGDFVHLKPHGARALSIQVGQTLQAGGRAQPMLFGGHRALEAETANGIDLSQLKHGKKAARKAAKKAARRLQH